MGLDVTVGVSALVEEDPEMEEFFRENLETMNKWLAAAGLQVHSEKNLPEEEEPVELQMWGYGGLHRLRRLAALLRAGKPLTSLPRDDDGDEDKTLVAYYAEGNKFVVPEVLDGKTVVLMNTPEENGHNFDHLVFHSDCDGFYVPVEFKQVVIGKEGAESEYDYLGSSFALAHECEAIAKAIGLPLDLDPDGDEIWRAADAGDLKADGWKKFGIEAFMCLRLYHAAKVSAERNQVLLFH